jgi:hypothetical protein
VDFVSVPVADWAVAASSSSRVPADSVDVVDVVPSDFADPASEDFSDELDWPSSAEAIAGLLAMAAPIPRATARPPTLPMNRP